MKPCPYCAESIQDAAAKCRFCGEWLDPSRRPAKLESNIEAPLEDNPVWTTPTVSPVPTPRPSGTVRKQTQVWTANVAPAVLEPPAAPTPREASKSESHLQVEQPRRPKPPPVRAPRPEALFRGNGQPAALDEVARRMERIKATADVVRSALASGATARPPANQSGSPSPKAPPMRGGHAKTGPAVTTTPVREPVEAWDEGPPSIRETGPEPPVRHPDAMVHGQISTEHASREATEDPTGAAPDALAAQFFGGQDLDGDDAEGGGLSAMESLVARHPPLPWRGILVGAAIVFLVSLVLLFTVFTDDAITRGDAGAEEPQSTDAAVPSLAAASPAPTSRGGSKVVPVAPNEPNAISEVSSPDVRSEVAGAVQGTEPLEPSPPSPLLTAQVEQARERYEAQDLDGARTILDAVLSKAPNLPSALLLLAQVQLEQDKMDESLQTASRCVQLDPKMADCWLTLGVLRQNREENVQAIEAYEKYLALAPEGTYANDVSNLLRRLR